MFTINGNQYLTEKMHYNIIYYVYLGKVVTKTFNRINAFINKL